MFYSARQMRRKATDLPPASDLLIAAVRVNRNPVTRVGALSEGQSEKAAKDMVASRVKSGKNSLSTTCWLPRANGPDCPWLYHGLRRVLPTAPPILELRLGISSPRNVPPERVTMRPRQTQAGIPAKSSVETGLAPRPKGYRAGDETNGAKGSGIPLLWVSYPSTSTVGGLLSERFYQCQTTP